MGGQVQLADRYLTYGYPTLYDRLDVNGEVVERKRHYRIFREKELQVPIKEPNQVGWFCYR